MKIGVFSTNLNFCTAILDELRAHHTVKVYVHTNNELMNVTNIVGLLNWCDLAYFDFIQYPLPWVSQQQWLDKPVVARMDGIDILNHPNVDWTKVSGLIIQPTQEKRLKRLRRIFNAKNPRRKLPPLPKKILLNFLGVDLNTFTPLRNRKPTHNILLHSGVIRETKGIYTALECFGDLVNRDPDTPWHFTLIARGEGGWAWPERREYVMCVEELLEDLNLTFKFTHIPGNLNKPEWVQFLKTQDLYWCFSLRESFGVSLAEACASGVYPLINRFYGAELLYPEENICKYPSEFVEKTMVWGSLMAEETKKELRMKISRYAERFDLFKTAREIRQFIEDIATNNGK